MAKQIDEMPLAKIKLNETLGTLFPRKKQKALEKAIKEDGYDYGHPVVLWKETGELVHGYTRYHAAKTSGMTNVPAVYISFKDLRAAVNYVIKIHRDQRALTDDVLLQCVETMNKTWPTDPRGRSNLAPDGAKYGKSAEELGALLGISGRKVERIRTILEHGSKGIINEVRAGLDESGEGVTINAAYNSVVQILERNEDLEKDIKRAEKKKKKMLKEIEDTEKALEKLKTKVQAQASGKSKEEQEQEAQAAAEQEAQAAAEQEREAALEDQVVYVRALNSCNINLPAYPPDVTWEENIFAKAQKEARSIYDKIEKLLFPGTGKGEKNEDEQKDGKGGNGKGQSKRPKKIGLGLRQIASGNS